jgi:hypothetical protein
MTTRRPEVAAPRPGEVIRYAYLWTNAEEVSEATRRRLGL